jgi:hypothetical protein
MARLVCDNAETLALARFFGNKCRKRLSSARVCTSHERALDHCTIDRNYLATDIGGFV